MARTGVTQAQVDAAADALLLAGERPTIERVRAHLGTGAPATLIRLLDVWWKALGGRLQAQALKVAMPEAPMEVAVAASQLWEVALAQARELARLGIESEKSALAKAEADLERDRQALQQQVEVSERLATEAERRSVSAEVRLGDLQRLLDQQVQQLDAQQRQREDACAEALSLREKLEVAIEALAESQSRAATERISLEAAHRAAETRWMKEVDRARQESERLAGSLRQMEQDNAAFRADVDTKLAKTSKALQNAEREQAVLTSRITTLVGEIERLHGQLREAIKMSGSTVGSSASETLK